MERLFRDVRMPNDPTGKGAWIVKDMIKAYIHLHQAGFAHSVESRFVCNSLVDYTASHWEESFSVNQCITK